MGDRAGDLDTEDASDGDEEAKEPGEEVTPEEHAPVPRAGTQERDESHGLSVNQGGDAESAGGAEVGPVGELGDTAADDGETALDEHGVHCDGEGRDEAVDESHGSGHGAQIKRRDTDEETGGDNGCSDDDHGGRTPPGVDGGDDDGEGKDETAGDLSRIHGKQML